MGSSLKPYSLEQIVINTRPAERAEPLTRYLKAAGLTVVNMPMLTLQQRSITATDAKVMRAWLAGEYQALVMVSPTAASLGLAMWRKLTSQDKVKSINSDALGLNIDTDILSAAPSHLIAVGTATAEVLQQAKLAAASFEVLQPAVANNEGMLAMPEIKQLQAGDKLLVWRGLGGRRLLVDTLQARGVHIDSIAWYERIMPDTAVIDYQRWVQQHHNIQATSLSSQPKPIVIISSGSVFEHWSRVVSQDMPSESTLNSNKALTNQAKHFSVADFTYIVLGVRLAEMLAEQNLDYLQVEDLSPSTILAAISRKCV